MREIKFKNPLFYIKKVASSYVIMHRLTHTYITAVDTEKEAAELIGEYTETSERELWEWLLVTKQARIDEQKAAKGKVGKQEKDEAEDWFLNAWSIYTDQFYSKYPKLACEVEEVPYTIIRAIKTEQFLIEQARRKVNAEERLQAEALYQEEQKKAQALAKESRRTVEEVPVGKIGSFRGLEKMKEKAKKAVRNVTIRTKKVTVTVIDSDDPFA